MKRIVEETNSESGLDALLGEQVYLMCCRYIYGGKLVAVGEYDVLLADACLVYETGAWDAGGWKDAQGLPGGEVYVTRASIEAYGGRSA